MFDLIFLIRMDTVRKIINPLKNWEQIRTNLFLIPNTGFGNSFV